VMQSMQTVLHDNVIPLSEYIHPGLNLDSILLDINYFVYSRDEYINFLVMSELIERLTGRRERDLSAKEYDGIQFKSHQNILTVDVRQIVKKSRQDIESFIYRIVRRKPLVGEKHVICLLNFDEICTRCQLSYKCLLEKNFANACFIFTSTKIQQGISNIYAFFVKLQVPVLSKKQSKLLLHRILQTYDDTLSLESVEIDHDMLLYPQVVNLNSAINGGRMYKNVFQSEICTLVDFLKNSKKKTYDKVIVHIRASVNKLLYYSIPDRMILKSIAKKIASLKKIDKHKSVSKICIAESCLINASKKIFVYELLFVELYELLQESY